MKRFLQIILTASSMFLLAACSHQVLHKDAPVSVQNVIGKDGIHGQIVGNLPTGANFSRLQIGMSRSEVEALVGRPTELDAQATGTAWVPYYFGSDTWSTESYYRGRGRLVFNADSRLVLIDVSENACK
ncbi:outer membrane protein assembly factor BamE [Uliginosibacterium sp. 31-16]|uniref:outer membrane protein assembly factor BamE domain-containing protein n=1 Tax=Uliginosibacterium sp. 31-16 TaxID=3068315 RepID=UPI00273F0609|nr:outer membrane protein assembly factor BamE [Uliginosibacterium sp. 31-16]MDP5238909.1 outer membrane protein assembly factor BamE [Uliginosibacterium sp. 31-16]